MSNKMQSWLGVMALLILALSILVPMYHTKTSASLAQVGSVWVNLDAVKVIEPVVQQGFNSDILGFNINFRGNSNFGKLSVGAYSINTEHDELVDHWNRYLKHPVVNGARMTVSILGMTIDLNEVNYLTDVALNSDSGKYEFRIGYNNDNIGPSYDDFGITSY